VMPCQTLPLLTIPFPILGAQYYYIYKKNRLNILDNVETKY
jgi:hypothetical protein